MLRLRRSRRGVPGFVLFGAGAGAAWLATYLDKRRRHVARDRVASAARTGAAAVDRKARYAAGVAKGNLLHTPGSPPKHSPPSKPDEARERFSREQAQTQ